MVKAPRQPLRLWRGLARGAGLAMALAGSGAAADCVTRAVYDAPTTRYAHGVLGDAIEYGALTLTVLSQEGERRVTVRLPQRRVFEDIAPRVVDVDLDGCHEALVVETDVGQGAQLAIYSGSGTKIAATPHIGQSNRWLAPVGAADLDGDGFVEIAYVDRPHLARVLRVWRFNNGRFEEVASAQGFSNHRIGWDFITGGIRDCGQGPEIIVADAAWSKIVAIVFERGKLREANLGAFSEAAMKAVMACR